MNNKNSLEKLDKKYLWHPFTQQYVWEKEPSLIIQSGQGVYLKDVQGKKYLDAVSSLWVNLLGHQNPALDKALQKQIKKISHATFLGLSHEPAIKLGEALVKLAPKGLERVFYSDNGATAVEIALKMSFQFWLEQPRPEVRPEFLALGGSYHGDTLGAVSVGSIGAFHSKFKPLLFKSHFAMAPSCTKCPFNVKKVRSISRVGNPCSKVSRPGDHNKETGCRWQCLGSLESILKKRAKKISAAIIEPIIQGATGMHVMPEGYVAGFQKLCRQYNVLLISDEVATGFGRTGTLFAGEQENLRPDFLCVAKALTGGYLPLSATLTTKKIYETFKAPLAENRTFFHGHSYTGNPLGAAVAVENLKQIEKIKLLEKTRQKAHILKDELRQVSTLSHVGSIRQAGLMVGIELVEDKATNKSYPFARRMGAQICKKLLTRGIWMRPLGDVLVIMPPPVISVNDLRSLVRHVKEIILHETES